jgi:hypothetical protein
VATDIPEAPASVPLRQEPHEPRGEAGASQRERNAEVTGSDVGGGGVEGLTAKKHPITVTLPVPVKGAIDERTGKKLGDGATFTLDFNPVEAAFFSFDGEPAR